MEQTYKDIVKQFEKIGIKSTLDNVPVRVIDLQNGVLVYDPATGWLAIRKGCIHENKLTNESHITYYNEVKYRNTKTPYCLLPELKELYNQIIG
jgi:hypothetical protein